ncbi:MAG: prolyl oligopeptidase family serine peptidase [Bacteroidia bacterium]|nr:prolyl oligopeptidase family serine peptidase [Bacteroidia bacterium]
MQSMASFLRILICILITSSLNNSFAQTTLSLESLLAAPFPTNLVYSPNGEKIAWVYNEKGVRNIWISSGTDDAGKQLTNYTLDNGETLYGLQFSADAKFIIYVKGDGPNRQGEIPNPTSQADGAKREIWKISTKDGKTQKINEGHSPSLSPDSHHLAFIQGGKLWLRNLENILTPAAMVHTRGGISQINWSPKADEHKIAFVSSRGDHSFIGIFDLDNHSLKYLSPSVDLDSNPVWSPQADRVAFLRTPHQSFLPFFERRSGAGWSVMLADVDSGESEVLWSSPEGTGSVFRFVSGPRQLYWGTREQLIFPYEGTGWTHLYSLSLESGQLKDLSPGEGEVQFVSLSANRERLYYSSNHGDIDRQHIWQVNLASNEWKQLTSGEGIEWAPLELPNGKLMCFASGSKLPAHLVGLDQKGKRTALHPDVINAFPSDHLSEPKQVIFPAADGMKIHGQLFLPKAHKSGEKLPGLLFFHGGSRRQMLLGFHHRGYYHNAYAFNQYMANQGYAVLSVNYRSGIGYGMEFREALNYGANGASEFNDVMGAAIYLGSNDFVDENRIGLWGGSYGGFLTAMGLARSPELFKAGVDIHGVHDWNVVIKNFVPGYNSQKQAEISRRAYESSPMNFIEGWEDPVLVIHGDDDRNVPFSESVDLINQLRKREIEIEQLIFPDEVHGFLLFKNWLSAFQKSKNFLNKHLK